MRIRAQIRLDTSLGGSRAYARARNMAGAVEDFLSFGQQGGPAGVDDFLSFGQSQSECCGEQAECVTPF